MGDLACVLGLVWQAVRELSHLPNILLFFPLTLFSPSPYQEWAKFYSTITKQLLCSGLKRPQRYFLSGHRKDCSARAPVQTRNGGSPRSPAAEEQSEVPETLLDAPKVEGLSASGKAYLFQSPAPLRNSAYLTAVSFVPCGKMVVTLPPYCQPYPQSSPSSSKHQLCPERQRLPVIITASDISPKGTGNVFLTIAEAPFMQPVDQCRALYSPSFWRVKVAGIAYLCPQRPRVLGAPVARGRKVQVI